MRRILLIISVLAVAPACAAGPVAGSDRPPDLVVSSGGDELLLRAYAYCWSSGTLVTRQVICADGMPPEPPPALTLNASTDLTIRFPLAWDLEASILLGYESCAGGLVVPVDPSGAPVAVPAPAGTYRVEVFGRGEGGDGAWAIELTTTADGDAPHPYAQVYWYPGQGQLDPETSFAATLGNLVDRPDSATATVSVAVERGGSTESTLTTIDDGGCWGGNVAFAASPDFTAEVVASGPPPYQVTISFSLDRRNLSVGPITWPNNFPENSNESARFETTPDAG